MSRHTRAGGGGGEGGGGNASATYRVGRDGCGTASGGEGDELGKQQAHDGTEQQHHQEVGEADCSQQDRQRAGSRGGSGSASATIITASPQRLM